MKFLVTAGGTREPIDGVRYIGNSSSGQTGAEITDTLVQLGETVLHLAGQGAILPQTPAQIERFTDYQSLDRDLISHLGSKSYDCVIHLAAVADYSVASIHSGNGVSAPNSGGKLSSDSDELTLTLRRNPKIVSRLKSYARGSEPVVVAFKLTHHASAEERLDAVRKLAQGGGIDFIVHNDLAERQTGQGEVFSIFKVYAKGCERLEGGSSPSELARKLHTWVSRERGKS